MQPRTALVVLVFVLAALGAVGGILVSRRVEERRMFDLPLDDGRHVRAIRLIGPRGTPEGELRLEDAHGEVVWRHSLASLGGAIANAYRGHVLFRHDGHLAWVEIDTGRFAWEVEDQDGSVSDVFFVDDDVIDTRQISYSVVRFYRRRSLTDGAVRWDTQAPPLGEDEHWDMRHYAGQVFLDAPHTVARLALDDGTIEPLAPLDATAACIDAEGDVAYRDASAQLWLRVSGGEPRAVGSVPTGRLECARADERIWITWEGGAVGRSRPRVVDVHDVADAHVPPDDTGALFVLSIDGALRWSVATAWGAPALGFQRPHGGGTRAWHCPGVGTGRLTIHVVEQAELLGEEVGERGGGRIDVVIDEATGQML